MLVLLAAFLTQKDGGDSGAKDDGGDGGRRERRRWRLVRATECAADGSDYAWSDTVSGATRTIRRRTGPNRATADLNPGKAIVGATNRRGVPRGRRCSGSDLSLAAVGGIVGVALDGAVDSAYAGSVALEGTRRRRTI